MLPQLKYDIAESGRQKTNEHNKTVLIIKK